MRIRDCFLLFFLITTVSAHLYSNNTYIKNYSIKDGLPSHQVYDIIQDDYGYLWFSTDKGLSRYDGYTFKNFDLSDGLIDNVVFDFHKRENGDIWCTTNSSGLFLIKGMQPILEPYEFNDSILEYATNYTINGLFFDENRLYITFHGVTGFLAIDFDGTVRSKPIWGIDPENKILKLIGDLKNEPFFFPDSEDGLEHMFAGYPIYTWRANGQNAKSEALFVGEEHPQVYLNNSRIEWWVGNELLFTRSKNREVIASGILKDGNYWVGYRYGGVEVYNYKGRKLDHFQKDKSVTQLYVDHEDNVWISTLEHGVFKLTIKPVFVVPETEGHKVTSIEGDNDGNLFIGFDLGSVHIRNSAGVTKVLYQPDYVPDFPAILLHASDIGVMFFQSIGVFSYSDEELRQCIPISTKYLEYMNGYLFRGAGATNETNAYENLDQVTRLFSNLILYDVEGFHGKAYGAGLNGLYYHKDLTQAAFQTVLSDIRIDDLNIFDEQLVLGTNGNGIIIIDSSHNYKHHITENHGLNSDYINSSYSENDSVLWVCSNAGINRIQFDRNANYTITSLNSSDGLASDEVWDVYVLRDTVWVATQSGLNYLSLDEMVNTHRELDYFLKWERIAVNNQDSILKERLPYDQNELSFSYSASLFRDDELPIYRYKLAGLYDAWRYTTDRTVTFPELNPGNYRLTVQVKGENSSWEKNSLSYSFEIRPPFWRTWWFIILCFASSILLIYLFFKVRILTYNKDIVREILRYILRQLQGNKPSIIIKHEGKETRLRTSEIHFIKSDGNYLRIHTKEDSYLIRSSINAFLDSLPDRVEFLQVHRSYIVRIEHIQQKAARQLYVMDVEIPVGRKFIERFNLIQI